MKTLKIKVDQVLRAVSKLNELCKSPAPKARFQTNETDWIIEVEHLGQNGAKRLEELLSAGIPVGKEIEFEVGPQTGRADGNQHHVGSLHNGTYAVCVSVRDSNAPNFFRRAA